MLQVGHVVFARGTVDDWVLKFEGEYGRVSKIRLRTYLHSGAWLVEKVTVQVCVSG